MRAPTINETMFGGSHPGGTVNFGGIFFPNPFLDPEIQRGWEFGANVRQDNVFRRGDRLRFKADYFRMNVEDYIVGVIAGFVPNPIPPPPPIPVLPATLFVNAPGTSLVHGVEVQGSYDAGDYFGSFSYTWTESDLPTQINGQTAYTYMPDYVLTLTGGLRFLEQRLTVGARGYFVGEGFSGTAILDPIVPSICTLAGLPAADCTNGPNTEPYALLDLFSNYKFDNGLELGLTVTNVFDLAYTPATETPIVAPPGAPPIFAGELGRGRTFLLSARAQF
jgi:hemoglobin/transferrin/lactoferrin receptor protein